MAHNSEFAHALRHRISERSVTLSWLHERLRANGNPVSMATLSYWRSGARRPEGAQSLAAISDIEQLLELQPGSLTDLLGPTLRLGPLGTASLPMSGAGLESAVLEVFTALGATRIDEARDVSTHAVTDVGPAGTMVSRTTRSLVQSTSGTLERIAYVEISPGRPTPAPRFRALGGAEVAQLYSHPSGEVHGVAFQLERPLHPTRTALLEWQLELGPDHPPTQETGHGVARRARDLVLWTRFHPDAIPDWLEENEESPDASTRTPLELDGGTTVHQVRRRFGPGMLALRWGFDGAD